MACPFFFPAEKIQTIAWAFPARLPLGAGFCGTCRAAAEEVTPTDDDLRDFCNLGYGTGCHRLPADRRADCLRFSARDNSGRVTLSYVYERDHAPVEHGSLEYDCATQSWPVKLKDDCAQRQAELYLAVYLERRRK
ncbi:MAG TPA: hypothetical protein VN669_05075 [Candidatus Acidoferrales bacterium]|nr:hypothetical protein [Candidatus Acidoferrales bacterium]